MNSISESMKYKVSVMDLNDLTIHSQTLGEHLVHIREVITLLPILLSRPNKQNTPIIVSE
jgi:hypothetical protein